MSEIEIMDQYIKQVLSENPKIDSAIKNLLSILISKFYHDDETPMDYSSSMACAKIFLKTLNKYQLTETNEYFSNYKQEEKQSGIERIDEICKYKVILALHKDCLNKTEKISKRFGKSYFLWTNSWSSLKKLILDDSEAESMISFDAINLFLNLFEQSLVESIDSSIYSKLIWAKDFTESLKKLQENRNKDIKKRLDDLEALQVEELKEAIIDIRSVNQSNTEEDP